MEVFAVSLRSPALKNTALQALMNLERFLVGKRRDSNPQGCGAEETRSVFQRSTQGAKRRSGARPPKRRTRNPSVPYQSRTPRIKKYQPSSEKRAAIYKMARGPGGPGIKLVASSARKEGHATSMFWT